DRALIALAAGDPAEFAEASPGAAYAAALTATPQDTAPPEGRGLALLSAIADVDAGLDGDTARAAAGLRRMVELGHPADARRAAGRGLALLSAMADVDAGLDGDTARAAAGLRRMVELGHPADARWAAVELLLGEHMGLRR